MKAYNGVEGHIHPLLTSVLDEGEKLHSRPSHLSPVEMIPQYQLNIRLEIFCYIQGKPTEVTQITLGENSWLRKTNTHLLGYRENLHRQFLAHAGRVQFCSTIPRICEKHKKVKNRLLCTGMLQFGIYVNSSINTTPKTFI